MGTKKAPKVRVDPELARISIGLQVASQLRLWVIARHLTRLDNGSSKVCKRDLKATLHQYEIIYTRQHFNALLRAGEGLFWNSNRRDMYIRSRQFVAKQLTQRALDDNRDLLLNKAGVTEVLLSPSGSLEQWQAMIYAGWIAHRNNPTISREKLVKLFGRTAETLRRWEDARLQNILSVRKNYAQCDDATTWDSVRPAYTMTYIAQTREGEKARFLWQIPNTYQVKGIKIHRHNGQSKKVRKAVNQQLQQPANQWRGGLLVAKLYFDRAKRLKTYLKEHDGTYYLWRGENRHEHGIFEATQTAIAETNATERVSFHRERQVYADGKVQIPL